MDPRHEQESSSDNSGPKAEYRRGATIAARVVAGLFGVFFALGAVQTWREDSRGGFSLDSALSPVALLCVAASVLCVLVALGRVGRHKKGWI
jgi:hypothetical protein